MLQQALANLGIPWAVLNNPAVFRSMRSGMSVHQSKIQNMYDIMGYYGGSQGCTLLYDNDAGNIAAVKGAGFATEQVETCVAAAACSSHRPIHLSHRAVVAGSTA